MQGANPCFQAHRPMTWRSRVQTFVERYLLGWYDPRVEAGRNRRTERIRQSAIKERQNAERVMAKRQNTERVMADYRATDARIGPAK